MNQKTTLPTLLAACALATCTDEPSVTLTPVEEWTTEPHYEIGDQMEGDALFARITSVVPTPDGSRVYVLDRQAFEVTIWTPDGTLIGRVGRAGDGPGDFGSPGSLFLFDDGFQVAEGLRITTFSLDGDLVRADGLERAMNPSGDASFGRLYHAIAMFDDRSVGAVSSAVLVWSGSVTEEMSEDAQPVVRITQDGGSFGVDPRIWYAVRKREDDRPIRRIVVPESFRPLDANATQVWGVRTDEVGVQYVAGLRLVRTS